MKKRVNFSVEEVTNNEFDTLCKAKAINKSAWIEQKMKEFITENRDNEEKYMIKTKS